MRQLLEEQVEKFTADVEDLKLKLSEEMDRVAFLERERACHAEVRRHYCLLLSFAMPTFVDIAVYHRSII